MKNFLSRFLVISILSLSFLNVKSFDSSASPVLDTGLKEASASDADREFDIEDTETYFYSLSDGIQTYASGLPSVENTVDLSKIRVNMSYFTDKDVSKVVSKTLSSDGYFSFSKPSDFASFNQITFTFISSSGGKVIYSVLPSPGNYDFSGRFSSNTGGFTWNHLRYWRSYYNQNAATLSSGENVPGFRQESGDWYFSTSLKVASNVQTFSLYFNMGGMTDLSFPFGGYLSFRFSQISTSAEIDSSIAPPPSSEDVQTNISNSVQDISSGVTEINQTISSGVADINGNLEEIIRTISLQLEAFWQQLYNGIHLPDMQNRNENTDKVVNQIDKSITALDSDVNDGFESLEKADRNNTTNIINNNNSNTQQQINNDNANHENLVNGYDNSVITNGNDKLAGKLDEYEKLEEELLSDTKDNLNNFQFENPFLSFNAVMSDISYILTAIYNGLGSFNIPIAFSMTLTIAMLCIGWYRFKGGT